MHVIAFQFDDDTSKVTFFRKIRVCPWTKNSQCVPNVNSTFRITRFFLSQLQNRLSKVLNDLSLILRLLWNRRNNKVDKAPRINSIHKVASIFLHTTTTKNETHNETQDIYHAAAVT